MLVLAESKVVTGVKYLKNVTLERPLFVWFWVNALVSLGWGGGRPCASRRPLLII